MLEIERNIPVPPRYVGRKSPQRDAMVATMRAMNPGESFRAEYKLAAIRNFLRNCGVEGSFRAAQETDTTVRVWRVS
jgi:hypothetical protein